MTHPVWGVPVFLCIMALVFFLTFFVGDFLKGGLEYALAVFSDLVRTGLEGLHVTGWMISLVVDGVIAGVGGILTFIPNIFILFLYPVCSLTSRVVRVMPYVRRWVRS